MGKKTKDSLPAEADLNAPSNKDPRSDDQGKRSKNMEMEYWLAEKFDFRFNTIKQKVELRERATNKKFAPITKYQLLTMKRELDKIGYSTTKDNLHDILFSSFSEAVNPVEDYLKKLPEWDKQDHIRFLANTVKAANEEKWYEYFRKWIVGAVANVWIEDKCANQVMLVLTGDQGKYKTTWLENLCPKPLKEYLFTGKLNLESKDTLTMIAEYWFINIDDQLKQLHRRDENDLKNLITINKVSYRRPYDAIINDYPHLASFMGSVNGDDFLNDPSGSRRFLPFRVLDINIKAAQEYPVEKVWAQAVHLFKKGEQYWFTEREVTELHKHNTEFNMVSQEQELLFHYFRFDALAGDHTQAKFMQPATIKSYIDMQARSNLSIKNLGAALTKAGCKKVQRHISGKMTWGYWLYQKSQDEIDREQTMVGKPEAAEIFSMP